MKRKVVKHGPSTYIISLPSKWVKEKEIKQGMELEVFEEGNKIIISSEDKVKPLEIDFDITSLDRTAVIYAIRGFYRSGYDIINLKFDNPFCMYQRERKQLKVISVIHSEVNRLIGFEIIQEREKSCIIKDLQSISEKEFDQILRRVFFLLLDASKEFIEGAKTNNTFLFETINEKHDNIIRFISYCLRTLNKVGYVEPRKTSYYYHIVASFDRIMDIILYASRELIEYNHKLTKEVIKILEKINEDIIKYHELFYSYDKLKMVDINNDRYVVDRLVKDLPNSIKTKEAIIAVSMYQILEILLDLIEARTALEY